MPHFDQNGNEEWICQSCGKIRTDESVWMTPVPGKTFNGNVCADCVPKEIRSDTHNPATMICTNCGKEYDDIDDISEYEEFTDGTLFIICKECFYKSDDPERYFLGAES